jgi:hypothetical protein
MNSVEAYVPFEKGLVTDEVTKHVIVEPARGPRVSRFLGRSGGSKRQGRCASGVSGVSAQRGVRVVRADAQRIAARARLRPRVPISGHARRSPV